MARYPSWGCTNFKLRIFDIIFNDLLLIGQILFDLGSRNSYHFKIFLYD